MQAEVAERSQMPMLTEFDPDIAAMIRREVEPGAALVARWQDDNGAGTGSTDAAPTLERRVDVAALPFAIQ